MIPSTSAPIEELKQILPRTTKRTRKNPMFLGFESYDSSFESTKSYPPNPPQPLRKRRAGDIESVQPSIVQTRTNAAAQVEPIQNPYWSPIIGEAHPLILVSDK